jgi:hypothetical protein
VRFCLPEGFISSFVASGVSGKVEMSTFAPHP